MRLSAVPAHTEAKLALVVARLFLAGILLGSFIFTRKFVAEHWNEIEPLAFVVGIFVHVLLFVLGVRVEPWRWQARLTEWVFNWRYQNKLRQIVPFEEALVIDNGVSNGPLAEKRKFLS
jgi:hypothetical protein